MFCFSLCFGTLKFSEIRSFLTMNRIFLVVHMFLFVHIHAESKERGSLDV